MTPPFISRLHLKGLLSFGPEAEPLELRALNVLIGPNGSGKSNLVDALAVLRATPGDVSLAIRKGGGVDDWLHHGQAEATAATIEAAIGAGFVATSRTGALTLRYRLTFGADARGAFRGARRAHRERRGQARPRPAHPLFWLRKR